MDLIKSKKYTGVYYRKKKNGDTTFYFLYRDETGQRITVKVGDKSEGIDELYTFNKRQETIQKEKSGDKELPKEITSSNRYKITLDEVVDYYFQSHKTKSTHKIVGKYNLRIKPVFGEMNIYSITPDEIRKFRDELSKTLSPQTVVHYLEIMSWIFNYFIKYKRRTFTNPVLQVERPRVDNRRERFLSKEEVDLLLDELRDNFPLLMFVSLSLTTGGRKSTILNYKVGDVNLSNKTIQSVDFKNNTSYKSFLDDKTIDLIKIRMTQCSRPDCPLVWRDGISDLYKWIGRELKILLDNLFNMGLDEDDRKNRVVIHTLRHTTLSHLGMMGCSPFLIKKISNHKSMEMVERYVKLGDNVGRNEIEKLWGGE